MCAVPAAGAQTTDGTPDPTVPAAAPLTLRLGDSGPDVNNLNRRLQALSYLPAGPIPPYFDDSTLAAVTAFQKWTGSPRTGVVGPLTLARLSHSHRPRVRRFGGKHAEVDLSRQLVFWVSATGRVVETVSVATGMNGYQTPQGHFRVFRKSMWSWSHEYHVWMAYASYFVGGVAFHEGDLSTRRDSHGCVQLPYGFAKAFFAWLGMGTPVWVHR